ncbi:MAG TPA: hypothetical protein VJB65_00750 [Patescibacteria group bacterium]|nr:hypothetical protein [Patescibacteria group bacterium]
MEEEDEEKETAIAQLVYSLETIWKNILSRYLISWHDDFLQSIQPGHERESQFAQKIQEHKQNMRAVLTDIITLFPDWKTEILQTVREEMNKESRRRIGMIESSTKKRAR